MRRVLSALVLASALAVALPASAAAETSPGEPAAPTSPAPNVQPEEPCTPDENGNCLSDRDGGGQSDTMDNCPDHPNPGQEDNDGDGFGNVCDPTPNGEDSPPPGDSPPSTPGTNCDGGEGVYVYQHVDYQGGCHKLTGDSGHAYYWSTVGNDALSSVRIVGGWAVVLYTEAWYGGGTVLHTTSSPNPWSWAGGNWNDTVSSARVYRDADHDGHADGADNCPHHYNPGQENTFGDGRGDACETPPDDYYAQDAEEEYAEWVSAKTAWAASQNNEPVTIRESTTASDLANNTTCRRHIYRRRLGRFLWRRGFDQDVYWCWRGGAIVHWQAHSTPYEGGACTAEREPDVIRYGGGRGWSGVDVKTEVRFSCSWAPSFPLRDTVWLIGRYLAGGGTEFTKGRYF